MNKLKPLLLIGLLLFLLPSLHAQGVQVGPWISDTGENSLTILVNDNVRRLEFEYTRGGRIHVSTFNASGEKEFERSF